MIIIVDSMKKIKLNLLVLLSITSITFLGSCGSGNSAEDIEVSKLETACDFVSAMKTCAEEAIAIKGDAESPDDLSEDDKAKGMKVAQKIMEIGKAATAKGIKESELMDCPEFEEMTKMMKEMR